MAQINIDSYFSSEQSSYSSTNNENSVGFFSLKGDGDEALVRIMHDDLSSLEALSTHNIQVNGKYRRVNCLRESPVSPMSSCPLCESGNKRSDRLYVHLIEYTKDENGQVAASPKVFDRPISEATVLRNLLNEYGPLSDCLFKIKKNVPNGDKLRTTYTYIFANPNVYPEAAYKKIPDVFKNYSALGRAVMNKSVEDTKVFLNTGDFPAAQNQQTNTQSHRNFTQEQLPVREEYTPPVSSIQREMPENVISRMAPQQPSVESQVIERPRRRY